MSYRLSEDRQLSFSVLVEVFGVDGESEPHFDPQLAGELGFCPGALWVLHNNNNTHTRTVMLFHVKLFICVCVCVCVCQHVHLEENVLQLSTVFPTVVLGEEDRVRRDAVIRHPAVALQHPYHDVWETVLGLKQQRTVYKEVISAN